MLLSDSDSVASNKALSAGRGLTASLKPCVNNNYPKMEYSQDGNFKDTDSIRNLNQLKICCMSMQVFLNEGNDGICNFGRLVIISIYLNS